MVIGDIPPLDCALGVLGPRGPFCIPFSTSSKPIVILPPSARPALRTIPAWYDGYKAKGPRRRDECPLREAATGKVCYLTGHQRRYFGMTLDGPIVVAGAGSIGCFVGGTLAAAGRRVALLARPRVISEIESNGAHSDEIEGLTRQIAPRQMTLSGDPRFFPTHAWCWSPSRAPTRWRLRTRLRGMRRPIPSSSVCRTVSAMCDRRAGFCRDGACWRRWCRSM